MHATQSMQSELELALLDFQRLFNSNLRAQKLAKKWNRKVFVDANDSGAGYVLVIADQQMREVGPGSLTREAESSLVHMQADEATLARIFSGNYNPSNALLDGVLSVFADERDKVKLEALALVIWGL